MKEAEQKFLLNQLQQKDTKINELYENLKESEERNKTLQAETQYLQEMVKLLEAKLGRERKEKHGMEHHN